MIVKDKEILDLNDIKIEADNRDEHLKTQKIEVEQIKPRVIPTPIEKDKIVLKETKPSVPVKQASEKV